MNTIYIALIVLLVVFLLLMLLLIKLVVMRILSGPSEERLNKKQRKTGGEDQP